MMPLKLNAYLKFNAQNISVLALPSSLLEEVASLLCFLPPYLPG
jgi:hypothetical protein